MQRTKINQRSIATAIETIKAKRPIPECVSGLLVLFFRFIYYKNAVIPEIGADSNSYITLTVKRFLHGERMPLYPFVIWLNKLLFQDNYQLGVVGCQIIVSLIAVFFLYKAVRLATGYRSLACIAATFFGCCPAVTGYDAFILSESFAISISIFLLYCAVQYINKMSNPQDNPLKAGLWMLLWAFLGVYEKSALISYVFAVLALLIIQFFCMKNRRAVILRLIAMTLCVILLLLINCYLVYSKAGIFYIDKRTARHMTASNLQMGLYKNYPDQELANEIDRIYSENNHSLAYNDTLKPIMQLFGNTTRDMNLKLGEFNSYCIRSDLSASFKLVIKRIVTNAQKAYSPYSQFRLNENPTVQFWSHILEGAFSWMKIGHLYIVGAVSLLLLIIKWIKQRSCPWYYLGAAGIIVSNVLLVFIGTYASFVRCTIYILPFACFAVALFASDAINWLKRKCCKSL